jgi:ADP-ribose pyrophosphatase YjhB (NUDIX family)
MHWIARHILKRLAFADNLTYSELKPEQVEGNLFQYHARSLEKDGLITRGVDGYALTNAGQVVVADLSQTKLMRRREQPQLMVAVVVRRGPEILLFEWKRHPYRGRISLPMGRHGAEMDIVTAAADQLFWKAGLVGTPAYIGQVELITCGVKDIDAHTLINVVEFTDTTETALPDGMTGQYLWAEIGDIGISKLVPGFSEIIDWCINDARLPYLSVKTK